MSDNGCPVCYRFVSANRATIRKFVIEENSRLGYVGIAKVKQSLCAKCEHVGYSAQGHTVGEAGIPLDTTEAETAASSVPLPTLTKFGVRDPSHHEFNVRRLRREKLRRRKR
jgi:hypothetical protein